MTAQLIVGADAKALDALAKLEYQQLYPGIFKRKIPVNQNGFKSISYDVTEAPGFDLTNTAQFRAERIAECRARLEDAGAPPAATLAIGDDEGAIRLRDIAEDWLTAASSSHIDFGLSCCNVMFTVEAANGATHHWKGRLDCRCEAAIDGPATVTLSVEKATLTFTGKSPDKTLEWLINGAVLPELVKEFNKGFLPPMTIPLQIGNVVLSTPEVAVHDGCLLIGANRAADSTPVTFPKPGTAWPAGRAFVLMEKGVLNDFILGGFDTVSLTGGDRLGRWGIVFHASYFLGLRRPQVEFAQQNPFVAQFEAAGDGQITASVNGYSLASATFDATARPQAILAVALDYPHLDLKVDRITHQDVTISIPWLPKPIRKYAQELAIWLSNPLTVLLENLLLLWKNSLTLILPTLQVPIGGQIFTLSLQNVEPMGLIDAGGTERLGFAGYVVLVPG